MDSGDTTQSDFRRVPGPDLPADWTDWADAAYSDGPMQAGDILGAWVFRDIQDAFNRLIWTQDAGTTGIDRYRGNGGASSEIGENWLDAQSDAVADWQSVGFGLPIIAYVLGDWNGSGGIEPPTWGATQFRGRSNGEIGPVPKTHSCKVEFYARAAWEGFLGDDSFSFNAHADPPAGIGGVYIEDQFRIYAQSIKPITNSDLTSSDATGNDSSVPPNWTGFPDPRVGHETINWKESQGYGFTGTANIMLWNEHSDGITYY